MGAKNCPETPRQKMIGMMYLVLTAMLALNVSKDILNSFVTVNESMEVTNANFDNKVGSSYQQFQNAFIMDSAKVGENYRKAQEVKKLTANFIDYIKNTRAELLVACDEAKTIEEAKLLQTKDVEAKDNYDKPTTFFLGASSNASAGKAKEIKEKIVDFRKKMLSYADTTLQKSMKFLDTDGPFKNPDGQEVIWENYTFYNTILIANLVNLNKIIGEARNAEFDVVNNLFKQISARDFKFDKVVAKVIPKSNYVVSGEAYEAQVIIAAYDSRSILEGELNGKTITGDSGVLNIRIPTGGGGTGEQKYSGIIKVKNEFGEEQHPFGEKYFVAQPSATVSATKMNVFYVGVDNPVSISVPGASAEDVSATISGGTISKVRGSEYVVKVTQPGQKVQIVVTANMNGTKRNMGSFEYRVKRVPQPTMQVGSVITGAADKNQILSNPTVFAKLIDFDFELNLSVTSFSLSTVVGKQISQPMFSKSNKLTPEMTDAIRSARRGQKFYFENIQYRAPEGTRTSPSGLVITIQ